MNKKIKGSIIFGTIVTIVLILIAFVTHKIIDAKDVLPVVVSSLIAGALVGFVWYWVKGKIPM